MPENHIEIKEQKPWHLVFAFVYLSLLALSTYYLYTTGRLAGKIPVFDFIIVGIAIFRLIHLLVYDYIMHVIRDYFEQFQTGPRRTIANLLECPWCTGMWVALLVGFLYFWHPAFWYPLFLFAIAGVGTFIDITAERIMKYSHGQH